jgi:hypothetical protein
METAPKRINWKIIIVMFGASLFLGIAIFTALVGAFFPAINNISRPLLCDGEYNITTTRSSYRPGETTWSHNIDCNGRDITLPSVFMTGFMVSLVIFVLILIRFRKYLTYPENFAKLANDLKSAEKSGGKTTLDRLTELKDLRDKNLISQVEYERKKDEIMKEL